MESRREEGGIGGFITKADDRTLILPNILADIDSPLESMHNPFDAPQNPLDSRTTLSIRRIDQLKDSGKDRV